MWRLSHMIKIQTLSDWHVNTMVAVSQSHMIAICNLTTKSNSIKPDSINNSGRKDHKIEHETHLTTSSLSDGNSVPAEVVIWELPETIWKPISKMPLKNYECSPGIHDQQQGSGCNPTVVLFLCFENSLDYNLQWRFLGFSFYVFPWKMIPFKDCIQEVLDLQQFI